MLQASKKEATLAVDLYNRASGDRSLEGFVVHMHLAWLYLLQARFVRDGIDYRYRKSNRVFERVDGEIKTWDLARCVREQYTNQSDPVRSNIEFFIRLRNKIEHRYERLLAVVVAGKTQAQMLNYEEALTTIFGSHQGLGEDLRFPVFVSTLTSDAVQALKRTHRQLPKRLVEFIREYDASMPEEVQRDPHYDFRVLLLPQTGPKSEADAAIRFVRADELTDKQRQALDIALTIVRTKKVPVQNLGRHKPSAVAESVEQTLGVRFDPATAHSRAWHHYNVRPEWGSDHPEETDATFCVFDPPHGDYLYTDAWIKKLIKELADPAVFEEVIGHPPVPLQP